MNNSGNDYHYNLNITDEQLDKFAKLVAKEIVEQTLSEDRQKQRLALTEKIEKLKVSEFSSAVQHSKEFNMAIDEVLKVIQEEGNLDD